MWSDIHLISDFLPYLFKFLFGLIEIQIVMCLIGFFLFQAKSSMLHLLNICNLSFNHFFIFQIGKLCSDFIQAERFLHFDGLGRLPSYWRCLSIKMPVAIGRTPFGISSFSSFSIIFSTASCEAWPINPLITFFDASITSFSRDFEPQRQ